MRRESAQLTSNRLVSARRLVSPLRTELSKTEPPEVVSARSESPALKPSQDPFCALFDVFGQGKEPGSYV
ncbi:uncharacterized protein CLUP02_09681 [Colletotrichum lupini]|uniref:Uncharacterized protein n=1 Tax=Colletotrichum lupini TaxID=145971 RepID=A0A9Q8WIU2_9PEZI|nr:uncharacterized protein CLUP02_09681 [Colletotrichum lupini]KAK1711843.1 hypothetical protein BDP67DRAFT_518634 [Colletotrichum lupini]UQC84185.1 hypothetical protein CLUP02_09681 [Colletotrichum lupini]